jgi:hypothetical protein
MDGYYWVTTDFGYVLCKSGEQFGYRTRGEVVRCKPFGGDLYYTVRIGGTPVKVGIPDREDAQKYTETMVLLKGEESWRKLR